MQIFLSAKEINAAAGKKGCEAIPYPDLRIKGKKEYEKQLKCCKDYNCDSLKTLNEVEAARARAKSCREQRIIVRTVFAQAIGRVKEALKKMANGEPLKPSLADILKALEQSQKGHEIAIDEVNNAFQKCEQKLKKLKSIGAG